MEDFEGGRGGMEAGDSDSGGGDSSGGSDDGSGGENNSRGVGGRQPHVRSPTDRGETHPSGTTGAGQS